MLSNFIVFILCALTAILHGYYGNIGWTIVQSVLALLNLPFAIKWIKGLLKNTKTKLNVCAHEWEVCEKETPFYSLNGKQLYKRCIKCGAVEDYIYLQYEGNGYK